MLFSQRTIWVNVARSAQLLKEGSGSTSTSSSVNWTILILLETFFHFFLQETGTLSIGRYSGELKAGQIFSGGNLVLVKIYHTFIACLTGDLRIREM